MHRLVTGAQAKALRAEVYGRADADRRERTGLRIGLGVLDVVDRRLEPFRGRDDHHVRHAADGADRHEILRHVVAQPRIDRGRDRVRRGMHQHGVAVGFGLRRRSRSDRAAGAAAILHHDRLSELPGQLLEHDARHDVDRTARSERDDGADRLCRPCVGEGAGRQRSEEAESGQKRAMHGTSSLRLSEDEKASPVPPNQVEAVSGCGVAPGWGTRPSIAGRRTWNCRACRTCAARAERPPGNCRPPAPAPR